MKNTTLTRLDIINAIYREIGLSQAESSDLMESIIEHIGLALLRGEDVKLPGFGKFSTRHKKERFGQNPKTGKVVLVSERQVVIFKASEKLRSRVSIGCK